MQELLVLDENTLSTFQNMDIQEATMLSKANQLLELEFPDHSLLELWNASIHNLRRRVEIYSIEIFISTAASMKGRKEYKKDGDSLSERWSGVDDALLLEASVQMGILNKKAYKALETVNWMRNHASPAHDSEDSVSKEDVIGLVLLLRANLWDVPMPDPTHASITLVNKFKTEILTEDQIELFKEQIVSYKSKDIETIFGYALNVICSGESPAYDNISKVFKSIWDKVTDEKKRNMGLRLHNYRFDPGSDKSSDSKASERLYDFLLQVDGIKYIPDLTRALIYRKLAHDLAKAKDTPYGWELENSKSRALAQVGAYVPSIAFEEVYQEILSVWCGNYWGRSNAHIILNDFIFSLDSKSKVNIAKLFLTNERANAELSNDRPKQNAISLLNKIKDELTNQSQISEIDEIITQLR